MRPDMGGKLPANKTAILQFPCLSDTDGAPVRRRSLDGRGSFAWHNPRKMCIRNYNIGFALCDNGSTASFTHCFHFQGHLFPFDWNVFGRLVTMLCKSCATPIIALVSILSANIRCTRATQSSCTLRRR